MSIVFDMPEEQSSIIKVIGVGGGGSNAVNYMYEQGIKGVNFVICNTDNQALEMSPVPNKIQLGPTLTNGRGAGAMPEVGKNATIESEEEIRDLLSINTKMVFVTAGMGGGTGTGGAPEVAKIAKELGILTVGIVTEPFDFEGKRKRNKADDGIEEMRKNVDALIIISNNKLRDIYGNLSLSQAFGNADSILSTAAKGISEIITKSGMINVDFEDVKTVMQESGVALMGTGIAKGENRALQAVDAAMSSPLLCDDDIHGAKGILLNITSGSDEIRMDEVTQITEYVQEAAANETEIIWGVCYDETLEDEIAVTLIATGFEGNKAKQLEDAPKQRIVHSLNAEQPKTVVQPMPTPQMETKPVVEETPAQDNTTYQAPQTPQATTSAADELQATIKNISFLNDDVEVETPTDSTKEIGLIDPDEFGEDVFMKSETVAEQTPPATEEVFDMTSTSADLFSTGQTVEEPVQNTPISEPDMQAVQRERMRKLKSIVSIKKIQNNQNLRELENQPAYMRKNVSFAKEQPSNESNLSKFKLEDNYEGKPQISENNSFLHDNVD